MAEKQRRHDHDWKAIKREYVEGFMEGAVRKANPTLDEVAARAGVHVSVVRKHAMTSAENWTAERELFQKRLEDVTREQTTKFLASKGAEFDALSLRVAEKLFKKIETKIDKALQANGPVELTPAQVAQLSAAAKSAQHVGRLVMGDSTENSKLSGAIGLAGMLDLSALSASELQMFETLLGKVKAIEPAPPTEGG